MAKIKLKVNKQFQISTQARKRLAGRKGKISNALLLSREQLNQRLKSGGFFYRWELKIISKVLVCDYETVVQTILTRREKRLFEVILTKGIK